MIATRAATTIPPRHAPRPSPPWRHRAGLAAASLLAWLGLGAALAAPPASAPQAAIAQPPSPAPPPSASAGTAVPLPVLSILYPVQEPLLTFDRATGATAGSLYDFTQALARKAGITLHWEEPRSRRRVLVEMASRADAVCTVNIARTPERAAKFKYTAPLTIAPDWVILVRADDRRIGDRTSVADLRRRSDLILGLPDGSFLEALIDTPEATAQGAPSQENRERISGSTTSLLTLLARKRVDFIPYDANTLDNDRATLGLPEGIFRVIRVPEFNFIGQGYMACGRGTPDAIIERLNRAVVATGLYTFN